MSGGGGGAEALHRGEWELQPCVGGVRHCIEVRARAKLLYSRDPLWGQNDCLTDTADNITFPKLRWGRQKLRKRNSHKANRCIKQESQIFSFPHLICFLSFLVIVISALIPFHLVCVFFYIDMTGNDMAMASSQESKKELRYFKSKGTPETKGNNLMSSPNNKISLLSKIKYNSTALFRIQMC